VAWASSRMTPERNTAGMAVSPVRRPLVEAEREILEILIETSDRRDRLREQLDSAVVVAQYPAEDPTIVLSGASRTAAESRPRETIDGVAVDRIDGGEVQIIVHVVEGSIDELEFFRYDSEPVHGLPDPATVRPAAG
jgi:hypothetical protein